MADNSTRREKEQMLMDVVNQMKEFTAPSITQICGNCDHETGELVGTGTFFRLRGADYLLTAQHVAHHLYTTKGDGSKKYPEGLSHSVGDGHHMMNVLAPWVTWNSPHDLAVTRLSPVVLEGTDRVPLNVDQIALNTDALSESDIYFIHGFPGKQSHFTTFFGRGVMSRSLPYGCWLENSSWEGFDQRTHFAITYPCEELIDERGEPTGLPHPGGLSGAVVWKTNREKSGKSWSPDLARIVGLAHRFDQESRCLVATRIEYVKGLLLHTLRSDYAFCRWMERGKPLWDDLADWAEAEAAICDLQG